LLRRSVDVLRLLIVTHAFCVSTGWAL